MNIVIALILGLILAAITYFIAALFLPYIICVLAALLVFLLVVFGGPHYYGRRGAL